MFNIRMVAAVGLCFLLFTGIAGCAKKNVRNLASDVCLVTPEKTTKEQVLTYLGQPDVQYEAEDGSEVWIYYDEKKTALRNTPYIGDKIGEENYPTVKVTFKGDTVRTCVYRLLTEEEFEQGDLAK
jgi:outer membrane protein assembly factor BamE (lipoprotein component of BamABCDE complex)